jgi:hypothetical protein
MIVIVPVAVAAITLGQAEDHLTVRLFSSLVILSLSS